jgi:quinol monooxygenase YgiN
MPQIAKVVRLKVLDGQREQLVAALAPVAEMAAADPGTEVWTIHADDADPNDVFIYEVYRDQAAADAHDESPVLKSTLQSTGALMAGPPEFIHGKVLASSAD